MPEIKRTTREVTRYTLDLSADEAHTIVNALLADGGPDAMRLRDELVTVQNASAEPLTVGDVITLRQPYGDYTKGRKLTVTMAPTGASGFTARALYGDAVGLALSGEGTVWERVTGESTPAPLAVGDRIRILRDGYHGARVEAGDVLTVQSVSGLYGSFTTNAPRHIYNPATGKWTFSADGEGDGWERVGLRRIAKGDDVRLLEAVGSYTAGRLLKVQEDPNRYRNFAARAPFGTTALLSEDSEGDVWQRVGA